VVIFQEKIRQQEMERATLEAKVQEKDEEIKVLRKTLDNKDDLLRELFVEKITSSDANVKKFLGLPSLVFLTSLLTLLNTIGEKINYWRGKGSTQPKKWQEAGTNKPGRKRKLTMFHEVLITLLRLRCGFTTEFLGVIFGVSKSHVGRMYSTWICLLDQVLRPLIKWPSKAKVKKHMPISFKLRYPNTRAIIDCTEFFVTKPKNPTAQSCTWSSYKSHNTVKCLLAITPNGMFSFVSDLWSGNISDRAITAKSGFLDLVERDDAIMADRGFLISDLLLEKGARLNMPPFTRACSHGKGRHLTVSDIKESKRIAHLRIHVERAIGRMKKFSFFDGTILVTNKSVLNQSLRVACALSNLKRPLVSKLS